jgi:hypothetical protein
VTLADKVFGGNRYPAAFRYAASWFSLTVSVAVAVAIGIWFVSDDVVEVPAGRWGVSLICAVMAAFSWWGNRYVRAEMRARSAGADR